MARTFRVAYTADFYDDQGQPNFRDYGPGLFDAFPNIAWSAIPEHLAEMSPAQIAGAQGVIVLAPRVTAESLSASQDLLAISRFGVGYDNVDVPACTEANVLATITRGAVDRSVAEATVGWMISLSHHVRVKDQLVREGRWDDRTHYMGSELRDRTLGIVGFGGIGKAIVKLLASFGMQQTLVFDPYLEAAAADEHGARKVDLQTLLSSSDYVSVNCPLNDETRDLIGADELSLMKPTAYLINTARGGIVNEDALFESLVQQRIAGAALDCFDGEPITTPHRFGSLENVLLAPHSIAWTHELFRDIGRMACQTMVDLAHGRRPPGVLNPEVFEQAGFQEKWQRLRFP